MLFKGPAGYARIMNTLMNLVLCACFSAYALWVAQNVPANAGQPIFTPLGWLVSFVMSFCVVLHGTTSVTHGYTCKKRPGAFFHPCVRIMVGDRHTRHRGV